jgi:predicted DNA-binding transcriptional regulator YafY
MSQTERIYQIDQMLHDRKIVSFAELQAALGISRATLKRDLEYMRSRLNAPIDWSRELGGYRFASASPQIGAAYELPGLWFNEQEIHALLTMQHLLGDLGAGGILQDQIAPLMARLNAMLGSANDPAEAVRRKVLIASVGRRPLGMAHFQQIGKSLLQGKRLRITYAARSTDETTEREVSPLRLVHYRENWYLDAWCHLRNELRNFSVDRIGAVQALEVAAKVVSQKQIAHALGPGYGIFAQGKLKWARLRFSAYRARWVANEQWHPDQHGRVEADGRYTLRVPYADHRELMMDILRFGADCEVLSPLELRTRVAEEVVRMGAIYR